MNRISKERSLPTIQCFGYVVDWYDADEDCRFESEVFTAKNFGKAVKFYKSRGDGLRTLQGCYVDDNGKFGRVLLLFCQPL